MWEHLVVISEIHQMQNIHRQAWEEQSERQLHVANKKLAINIK